MAPAIREASKRWRSVHHWKPVLQVFRILFGEERYQKYSGFIFMKEILEQSYSRSLNMLALLTVAFFITACGSNYDEKRKAGEEDRKAASSALEALRTFGSMHGAKPWNLGRLGSERKFTASLQEEIEGSTVAFRAEVFDLVRRSENDYELVVGDHFLGQVIVSLRSSKDEIVEILANPPELFDDFLFVAVIERVQPLHLEISPCDESDCDSILLEPSVTGVVHRIYGRLIAIQREGRRTTGRR